MAFDLVLPIPARACLQAGLVVEVRLDGMAGDGCRRVILGIETSRQEAKGLLSAIGGTVMTVEERLQRIEAVLAVLAERGQMKDFYEIGEFACLVGRKSFTVREWARHGRIRAEKKLSGRGAHFQWVVSHDELQRYEREGLRPRQARGAES
jgi:hypothetical protein